MCVQRQWSFGEGWYHCTPWVEASTRPPGAVHVGGASSSAQDARPWARQYYESLAHYLRKRYPTRWVAFPAVWLPYALVQSVRRPSRAGEYLGSAPGVLLPRR